MIEPEIHLSIDADYVDDYDSQPELMYDWHLETPIGLNQEMKTIRVNDMMKTFSMMEIAAVDALKAFYCSAVDLESTFSSFEKIRAMNLMVVEQLMLDLMEYVIQIFHKVTIIL